MSLRRGGWNSPSHGQLSLVPEDNNLEDEEQEQDQIDQNKNVQAPESRGDILASTTDQNQFATEQHQLQEDEEEDEDRPPPMRQPFNPGRVVSPMHSPGLT